MVRGGTHTFYFQFSQNIESFESVEIKFWQNNQLVLIKTLEDISIETNDEDIQLMKLRLSRTDTLKFDEPKFYNINQRSLITIQITITIGDNVLVTKPVKERLYGRGDNGEE